MTDFIGVYDNVLPPEFCAAIIDRFESSPHQGPGHTGQGVDPARKRSTDINISVNSHWQDVQSDMLKLAYPTLRKYFQKYFFTLVGALAPSVRDPETGDVIALNKDNFKHHGLPNLDTIVPALYRYGQINVQKYEKKRGGYPHWHSEIYPKDASCDELHRVLLFMFYLNDVPKGGETEFYYQNKKVAPKTGRMVIAPAGFTHTHRGNTPVSNDKYIATSWILYHRAEEMYRQRG